MNKGTFLAKWRLSSLMTQDLDALLYSEYKKGLNDDREYNEAKIKAAEDKRGEEVLEMAIDEFYEGIANLHLDADNLEWDTKEVEDRIRDAYKERFGK